MHALEYIRIVLALCLVLLFAGAGRGQAQEAEAHPRATFEEAEDLIVRAMGLIRQRRFTPALGMLAQSRRRLEYVLERWPTFRQKRTRGLLQAISKHKQDLYKLVKEEGLVEYQGRFYTFEQMQRMLRYQQEEPQKWMELMRRQEESRRERAEHMMREEIKRKQEEQRRRQEKQWQEQQRQQQEWRRRQQEQQQRQTDQLLREQQQQRRDLQERRRKETEKFLQEQQRGQQWR